MPARIKSVTSRGVEQSSSNPNLAILGEETKRQLKYIFNIPKKTPIDGLEFNSPIFESYADKALIPLVERNGISSITTHLSKPILLGLPDLFEKGNLSIIDTGKSSGIFAAVVVFLNLIDLPICYQTSEFSPDTIKSLLYKVTMLALIPETVLKEMITNKQTITIIHWRKKEDAENGYKSSNFLKLHYGDPTGIIQASIIYPKERVNMQGLVEERKKVVQESDKVFFLVD